MSRLFLLLCLTLFLAACATAPDKQPDAPDTADEEQDRGPDVAPDLSDVEEPEPRDEPLSRFGNPATYEVFGQQYQVMDLEDARDFTEEGVASWYGKKFHGRRTSSGEPYDMYTMTAAHPSLPLPTYVRVTNLDNGKSVIVRVNDRGPFADNRAIDLSYAAADRIDMLDGGTAPVRIEALSLAYDPDADDRPEVAGANGDAGAESASESAAPSDAEAEPVAVSEDETGNAGGVIAASRDLAERIEDEGDPDASQADTSGATGTVKLQLGAFSERANAESLRGRLQDAGLDRVTVSDDNGVHRVRIGPVESRDELDSLARKLRDNGFGEDHMVVE